MTKKKIYALVAMALLLFPAAAVYASGGKYSAAEETISQRLILHPIIRFILLYIVTGTWTLTYGQSFSEHYQTVILANPSVDSSSQYYNPALHDLMSTFVRTLTPFYLLAIVGTAFYMLFVSSSPASRSKSKSLLVRLMISLVLFSISPMIFESLLRLSEFTAKTILDSYVVDHDMVKKIILDGVWSSYWIAAKIGMSDLEVGIPYWTSIFVLAWFPYIMILLRYILVTSLGIVFPIGIFLYSFVFLRGLGKKILDQTILWIFMQVFFALGIMAISMMQYYHALFPAGRSYTMVCINVIPVPGVDTLVSLIFTNFFGGVMGSNLSSMPGIVDLVSYNVGIAAHAFLFALPLMMARIIHKFLP